MNGSIRRFSPRLAHVLYLSIGLLLLAGIVPSHTFAADLKAGETFKDCRECPDMVVIPPGTFSMGSPADEKDRTKTEDPQHEVTIRHAFALAKAPVTRDQYEKFVRATHRPLEKNCEYFDKVSQKDWIVDGKRSWMRPGVSNEGTDPVVCVSWDDAADYIAWINQKVSHHKNGPYRLPTEAEWEYAARAGTTTPYWQGAEIGKNTANCAGCGSKWDDKETAPVGSFPANPFHLLDMNGNAWQWVADCWQESYADASPEGAARSNGNCAVRGVRGGGFMSPPAELRSAARFRWPQVGANFSIGFRIARTLDQPEKKAEKAAEKPAGKTVEKTEAPAK
jgi:formylglycine-generating enzyme required for sulfatase activity